MAKTISYTVMLNEKQVKLLDKKYYKYSSPYGLEIFHMEFGFNECTDEDLEVRQELLTLGVLYPHRVSDTLTLYGLTDIGRRFYELINGEIPLKWGNNG